MKLLETLKHIRDVGPRWVSHGICYNLDTLVSDEKDQDYWDVVKHDLFRKWPEFSGSLTYPVPNKFLWVFTKDPGDSYRDTIDMWVGSYGRARLRLLNFLIKELERESLETTKKAA